jgi:hypothetical protein
MSITLDQIKDKTYEQAENMYFQGIISQDVWEEYVELWQTSATRYSSLGGEHQIK